MNFIYEEFPNINTLLEILDSRPNNKIMENEHASQREAGEGFSGVKTYADAVYLLKNGYTDILDEVKEQVRKNNAVIFKERSFARKQSNMPVGFIPNVPNALQNKPDSMINIIQKYQKRKTITIIYSMGGNANVPKENFIKAGSALVSAINLIELSGVQTRLLVDFGSSESNGELIMAALIVKNFGERFNLTKICFPMANPAMFRRIGFKYLETCPKMTQSGFSWGYGHTPDLDTLKENINADEQTVVIDTTFISRNDYSISAILKEFNFDIK